MISFLLLSFLANAQASGSINTPHIKAAVAAYQQGKAELLRKQPSAAVEFLEKAIEIEPTFLDAYKVLIDAHMAAGESLPAAAVMTRFLEIEPNASHYRIMLGQVLFTQKEWTRALAQYAFVLKETPFDADALWGFAAAAKELGMEERASEALAIGRTHHPLDKRFSSDVQR
jgi:tetratricopeptide (TPR) repeat protein